MQAIAGQQYDSDTGGGGEGALISSAFVHMRTVSAFSMQHKVSLQYESVTNVNSRDRQTRAVTSGIGFGAAQAVLFASYALLFWYGSTLITSGEVQFEGMMTAILSLMLGALGLGTALNDMEDQKKGLLAAKRIFRAIKDGEESAIDGLSQVRLQSILKLFSS